MTYLKILTGYLAILITVRTQPFLLFQFYKTDMFQNVIFISFQIINSEIFCNMPKNNTFDKSLATIHVAFTKTPILHGIYKFKTFLPMSQNLNMTILGFHDFEIFNLLKLFLTNLLKYIIFVKNSPGISSI